MFLAIVLGLALSDLCISLNRLLDAGARVRWDWLAPMAAIVALLRIITQWWGWFGAAPLARGMTFEMFVLLVVAVVLLFLMAAAALPDRAEADTIDLRLYYARVSRRYWLLFGAHYIVADAVSVWIQMRVLAAKPDLSLLLLLVGPAVAAALLLIRNRIFHTVCLVGLIGVYLVQSAGHALGN